MTRKYKTMRYGCAVITGSSQKELDLHPRSGDASRVVGDCAVLEGKEAHSSHGVGAWLPE